MDRKQRVPCECEGQYKGQSQPDSDSKRLAFLCYPRRARVHAMTCGVCENQYGREKSVKMASARM